MGGCSQDPEACKLLFAVGETSVDNFENEDLSVQWSVAVARGGM